MYIFKFVDIGEGLHEGTIGKILVNVGDNVKDGTDLFIVENEKMTSEISSPVNGVISKILFKENDVVHVGQELFYIDDNSSTPTVETKVEESKPIETKIEESKPIETKIEESKPIETKVEEKEEVASSVVGEVKVSNNLLDLFGDQVEGYKYVDKFHGKLISPLARKIAYEKKIDLSFINGTGLNGKIMVEDLNIMSNNYADMNTEVSMQNNNDVDEIIKPNAMRKKIAEVMKYSWNNVAYTNLAREIDITDLWDLRSKIKDYIIKKFDVKITFLPYIIKAICLSLKKYPIFNSIYNDETNEIIKKGSINIGIAVDTEHGLYVPVIKNADQKSIIKIASEINELAKKAREKKLTLEDLSGGTFSITNYGSLGVETGVPIIKYPELAIAGLGSIKDSLKRKNGEIIDRKVFDLTIACDHRWIDGADIARFINAIKDYIENPNAIFMEN